MSAILLRNTVVGVSLVVVGCGTVAGVCGCYPDSCSDSFECANPSKAVCPDPAAADVGDHCGVFVSSSLGDDRNPGTREEPVRTFGQAIALAQQGSMRVYACAEVFPEAITLPSGVEIWGALDCEHDWIYRADSRTIVAPDPNLIPLQIEPGEGGISVIANLTLEAADATVPGGSSIAMVIASGATAEVLRSELIAGDGADGAPGERGGETPAKGGTPGNSGAVACSADSVQGASAVTTVCGDIESVGGKGGDGGINTGGAGNDGQPEPVPNPDGRGLGGTGQVSAMPCWSGADGMPGADGEHGLGARGPGKITAAGGWEGRRGDDGGDGMPGQGGGGGGGSRGGAIYCGSGPKGGASGGSGGGGGCGGKGGKGGGYGGASIGLISFSGDVTIRASSIVAGNGGNGGAGGTAQIGGGQGSPGSGGAGVLGSHPGCAGGWGGIGGSGGYGGGGLGGPSLGIAHLDGQPPALHDSTIDTGTPGKGGPGGNQYVPGSAGEDGIRGDILGFPQ